jgi:carboxymethylenebutenolidase
MVKLPVLTKQVALTKPLSGSIESQMSDIYGYLAMPAGAGQFPGIIVLQEIFGVNTHIQAVTERIASLGYVAIAPALFDRFTPGVELGYASADIELGRSYAEKTSAPQLLTLPQVQPRFGCIGFCFGGHVAYLAATLPDINVTASFYGRGITTFTPGGGEASVSQTAAIAGTMYMFFGMEDASIPPEHIAEIDRALTQHDIPHQIWQYPGAEHGFCCDLRASYNPTAAESAWQHVEELFQRLI